MTNLFTYLSNGILKYICALVVLLCLGVGNVWGSQLFHETFGNKTSSGTADFVKANGVQSGVTSVYKDVAYTITNAKQSRNTTGQTQSPLMQTTANTNAVFVFGPLNVAKFNSLVLTFYWTPASVKGTYSRSVHYKIGSGSWNEVTKTSGSASTSFELQTYNLPAAAQVSNLYLQITWNTSNTQGKIDEVDLAGKCSVTYNGNGNTGGSVPSDATKYDINASVTVKSNSGSLEKTGYTFDGWNTKADGTGADKAAAATFTITQDTTLYAKWTAAASCSANPTVGDASLNGSFF